MKVHPELLNEYPFVAFHKWELRPLELVQMYTDSGGTDPDLMNAVTRLDPLYVKFRELDAMDNKIGMLWEQLDHIEMSAVPVTPDYVHKLLEMQQAICVAKKELILGADEEDLLKGRRSLLQIALFLEKKGCIEFFA